MGHTVLGLLLLSAGAVGQAPAGQDEYYSAATAAAREMTRELDLLQRSFATIPGPPEGRGLYQALDGIQLHQIYFTQLLQRKAPRSELYVAYEKLDEALNQLLGDVKDIGKWAPALALSIRRVRSAQHDVHVALAAGDKAPAKQGQAAYRQILAVEARAEDLGSLVRYVFADHTALPGWERDLGALRSSLTDLQRLQRERGSADEITRKMLQVDGAWRNLVGRYNELPEGKHLLLRSDFVAFDRQLSRLAPYMGVPDRRPLVKAQS